MTQILLVWIALALMHQPLFGQEDTPRSITEQDMQSIEKLVHSKAVKFKRQKEKDLDDFYSNIDLEFDVDTFRIKERMRQWIDIDYSTAGMRGAGYAAAQSFDSLLNKYYKLLLEQLAKEDRKVLIEAQRAWIKFKEAEMELQSTMRSEEYSGGGTIQLLIGNAYYLDLITRRACELYVYYRDSR